MQSSKGKPEDIQREAGTSGDPGLSPLGAGLGAAVGGTVGAIVGEKLAGTRISALVGGTVGSIMGAVAGAFAGVVRTAARMISHSEASSQIVGYLQQTLGAHVISYLSGVDDPDTVERWATGQQQPEGLVLERLWSAHEAARCLVDAYGVQTARSWFFGMNSLLDEESPAYVLRHGQRPEDWELLVPAAREFAGAPI